MISERLKKKLNNIQWRDESVANILIVDDEDQITELLKTLLTDEGYNIHAAKDGKEAYDIIRASKPDLVLTDVTMPEMNGFDLCRLVKSNEATRLIPVVLITALTSTRDKIRGIDAGADDFIGKPFNALELTTRVRSLLRVKNLNSQLEKSDQVILAFSHAVEARDPYTQGHSERVGKYGVKFAQVLGLDERYQQLLFKGAILHDIGKIGVRDSVLLKKGKLTDEEFAAIKEHPAIGMKICIPLKTSRSLLNIVAYHHERMDGTGYPYGLMSEEIPVESRIIGITDVFDALTSARPYRRALTTAEAIEIMKKGVEDHFDTDLIEVFLKAAVRGDFQAILEGTDTEEEETEAQEELSDEIIKELDFFDGNFVS